MIHNRFCFHPIGQGLFYSGSFNRGEYNFIYDCGTDSDQSYLNRQIDAFAKHLTNHYSQKSTLNFVVISHLHFDHMSGLPYLLQRFNIKNLYLPYLNTTPQVIDLILAYSIFVKGDGQEEGRWQLYDTMHNYYANEPNTDSEEGRPRIRFIREGENYFGDSDDEVRAASFSIEEDAWRFVLVNKTLSAKKMATFEQKLNDLTVSNPNYIDELVEKMKDPKTYEGAKAEIEQLYYDTFKYGDQINKTSIVLMHYPVVDNASGYISAYTYAKTLDGHLYNIGDEIHGYGKVTLLTGDAMMDKQMQATLQQQYNETLEGILQIPHHGSWYNYIGSKRNVLPQLWQCFDLQVISYGLGNKYHHPHSRTVDDILSKNKQLLSATQNLGVYYYIVEGLQYDTEEIEDLQCYITRQLL